MIKPTIGRVVWFWPTGDVPDRDAQPYPALVTFVHNEYVVNLAVFDRNGDIQPRQNVQLFQGDQGEGRPQEPHCEWMPYQKGQAAKVDAGLDSAGLEKRIAALEERVTRMADTAIAAAKLAANTAAANIPPVPQPPPPPAK